MLVLRYFYTPNYARMSKGTKIVYWILAVLIALPFFAGAYMKLTGSAMEISGFQNFGYAIWFMYVIGVLELLGALGILFGGVIHNQLPRLAALGLLGLLIGILYTHATHPPLMGGIPALIITVLVIAFLWVSGRTISEASV